MLILIRQFWTHSRTKIDRLVGKNIDQGKSIAGNAEKTGLEHQSFFN
jgi:hypothetical protein